ncbi:MAG TPA: hypothetical protein VHI51_19540, partial [Ktedonobacterales bacterium]|nr:hypothetical protein [Ktedonobacterales bacterium]
MGQASGRHAGGYIPLGQMTSRGATTGDDGAREWRFVAEDVGAASGEAGLEARVALLAEDIVRVRLLTSGAALPASWAVAHSTWDAVSVKEAAGASGGLS